MAKKSLQLSDKDINELLQIIQDCKSHLEDYSDTSPYYETYLDCDKWIEILEDLQEKQ